MSDALFEAVAAQDLKQLVKLLDAGEDPNPFDAAGLSPLMHAAAAGEELLVLALLDGGADPQLQDPLGETAYLKAAAHGQRSLCSMLARGGLQVGRLAQRVLQLRIRAAVQQREHQQLLAGRRGVHQRAEALRVEGVGVLAFVQQLHQLLQVLRGHRVEEGV